MIPRRWTIYGAGLFGAAALALFGDKTPHAPDGAEVELLPEGLLVRVSGGQAPYTWLADGVPGVVALGTREAMLASGSQTLAGQLDLERDFQRELGYTADYAEGVAAFAAKRAPQASCPIPISSPCTTSGRSRDFSSWPWSCWRGRTCGT